MVGRKKQKTLRIPGKLKCQNTEKTDPKKNKIIKKEKRTEKTNIEDNLPEKSKVC